MKKALLIIFSVLFVDQLVKFLVKTNMYISQEFKVFGNWCIIHFTENNGMAFGMELGGDYGKLTLSVLRIIFVGGIAWYLYDLIKKKVHFGLITSVSLIFAGAIGNILDSAFYGLIFSESSYFQLAEFMPEKGYAGFLHGKVVDMFYFPLFEIHLPQWFPIWGGQPFLFFQHIFNVADAAITIGVALIILFQKRFFPQEPATKNIEATDNDVEQTPKPEL